MPLNPAILARSFASSRSARLCCTTPPCDTLTGSFRSFKTNMAKHKNKQKKVYRVRNWREYNESLKQRGSLNIWLAPEVENSWYATPDGQPGSPKTYSDEAIETALTVRKLFRLPLRQTEGLLASLFEQRGDDLRIPNYTTLSRRGRYLLVKLPKDDKEEVHVVVDSSGVKVYGDGEWQRKKHGKTKKRGWKKIHVAIDDDGEIRATDVTDEDTGDSAVTKSLLGQEKATIISFRADGAYDTSKVYNLLSEHGIPEIVIPPRKNAKIWRHGNQAGLKHPRDENLRSIRKLGRESWEEDSNYHRRSKVENTMFRYKTILGEKVLSREDSRQRTELKLGFSILNRMFQLGMPNSYAVTI
jgi:hypothetical protein